MVSQMPGLVLESSVLERPLTRCPEEQQGWEGRHRAGEFQTCPQEPYWKPLLLGAVAWSPQLLPGPLSGDSGPPKPARGLSSTPRCLGLTSYCLGNLVLNSFYFVAEPCCMWDLSSLTKN